MDFPDRIESGMQRALRFATANGCPPILAKALRHAVFPGGARIRPRLCLAVAAACGDGEPSVADAAATAIELLHCASLVHDDMPCFDNAMMRRGRASVHAEFGEQIALLAGDGLIVTAFETIARETLQRPDLTGPIIATIAKSVGAPYGLVAGQAWESEPEINIAIYHRAKTASLFSGAVSTGAIASGGNPLDWLGLADALGAAYQVADDLYDAVGQDDGVGKPAGQDGRNAKPNIVATLGLDAALQRLKNLVGEAVDCVPDCPGAEAFRTMIRQEATRLMPKTLATSAA
ncbi:polyprenyl synthetase family protein [Rhizobium glycinendophyticum]|uniref:Polyprenyl synthetase family protein n=1 Tax=Rhizobium glycinendophyticum TaxID=2589807 RepID=A0A504TVJ7_9HYPH|nr:polyprenyl synthetase family protein [Rhizobium glycinendophyticum]TPP06768.1 polyprenyl synthetase family protein [Rhizobium glycinendophyticum]